MRKASILASMLVCLFGVSVSWGQGPGESKIITDNWNTGGCDFTNSAVMNLSQPAHVESVQLWYNWAAGETSLPYELSRGGSVLRSGQFRRGSCDPYQTTWCTAVDAIDMRLAPGSYTFTTPRRRVCQNGGSNGMGFIRVTGRTGHGRPEAYPGEMETQPAQPATPEISTSESTVNLALGKPTQQSSTFSAGYPASNGVDGRKDNDSLLHTGKETNPWWQVDLQGNYALSTILLYNRTNCCSERERTVQVLLSQNGSDWQTIYAHDGSPFQELRVEARGRRARYVRVQLAEQNYLHLQEVEVYGLPAAGTTAPPAGMQPTGQVGTPGPTVNLALGKPAQQSSTFSAGYPASNGVDGRKDNDSLFHTGKETNPWWQVDLQGNYALSTILLYNRTNCCSERERTVQVLLSQNGTDWQTIYAHDGSPFQELRVEARGRRARYVRVQLAEQNYLHLQEVEVYGMPAGSRPTDQIITPAPTTNLALGKLAQQSSAYSGDYPASNGVDGRKDDGSMFHTNNEQNPWWQVDLQGNYALSYIMLYNRTGCCAERERTVRVLLSQNGSDWQTIYAHNGTIFRELRVEAGGRRARYVRVQLAEQNYFHLQEVEVYGSR